MTAVRLLNVQGDDTHPWLCRAPEELAIGVGDACVVEADRAIEYGQVVSEEPGARPAPERLPLVLRRATMQDQALAAENRLFAKTALRLCQEKIREHKLEMRLVRVHYTLDRSQLTVTFTADGRVDFRTLVRDLAAETHARVEMRQIGARDQAAICGGMAVCGRVLCCAAWLREFDNINIRMAKGQGVSLNPAAVNGMCGRLKCCLRYEHSGYQDLARGLPREGARVRCPDGDGVVCDVRVLRRRVQVALDDQRVVEHDADAVILLGKPSPNRDNTPP